MVQFDNQYRQIKIKIVYYGPALGGKTTCLQHIHSLTDPRRQTKLYSLNTSSDRTLFFDLLSLNLGKIRGYELAMQLYTVPGQVQYDATRRAVLSGADGVVFVADSQSSCRQANRESLDNLWTNLAANGIDRTSIPLVLHYNKRDLEPLLSVAELDDDLNPKGLVSVPTIAVRGEGVMEGFAAIVEATLAAVANKLGVGTNPAAVARLQDQARQALGPYVGEPVGVASRVSVHVPDPKVDSSQALSSETLVGEAVRANLAMTELNARIEITQRKLEHKIKVLSGIQAFSAAMGSERNPDRILRELLSASLRLLGASAGTVMTVPGSGVMRELAVHGIGRDPILHASDETGESIATSLVERMNPHRLTREIDDDAADFALAAVEAAGFASALVVPLAASELIVGLLVIYGDSRRVAFDDDDLQLVSVLGATAALACASARSWSELEQFNRSLEQQVEARTGELSRSLEEAQKLAADLETSNRRVDEAYRELAEVDRIKDELIHRLATELKTPVSSVLASAKILGGLSDTLPPKGLRFVSIIRDEAEKLNSIIGSAFQASLLSRGHGRPERTQVSLEDLFKRSIAPLRELAEHRDISLKILISSGLKSISCDRLGVEAALRAVLKNAIEFNREGGEVKVAVRRLERGQAPWVMISVSDTGVGIPADEIDQVFSIFWQGSGSVPGRARGVGLGLAIAKMVVEDHGGSISVTSTVGEGTELTMTLPQGG